MRPTRDKNCQKYIEDPNRFWYSGKWMTLAQIENMRRILRVSQARRRSDGRANTARDNARRVYVGRYYVGKAPTPEQAAMLNNETRRRFA